MLNDDHENPYRTPAMISATSEQSYSAAKMPARAPSMQLRVAAIFQMTVLLIGLVIEAYEHETIIGSGPILTLVGFYVTVRSFQERNRAGIWLGGSAIILFLTVVFLINFNRWTPAQGDGPITLIAWGYAIVTIPLSIFLARPQAAPLDP